jgi:hypothetical protein
VSYQGYVSLVGVVSYRGYVSVTSVPYRSQISHHVTSVGALPKKELGDYESLLASIVNSCCAFCVYKSVIRIL